MKRIALRRNKGLRRNLAYATLLTVVAFSGIALAADTVSSSKPIITDEGGTLKMQSTSSPANRTLRSPQSPVILDDSNTPPSSRPAPLTPPPSDSTHIIPPPPPPEAAPK